MPFLKMSGTMVERSARMRSKNVGGAFGPQFLDSFQSLLASGA